MVRGFHSAKEEHWFSKKPEKDSGFPSSRGFFSSICVLFGVSQDGRIPNVYLTALKSFKLFLFLSDMPPSFLPEEFC